MVSSLDEIKPFKNYNNVTSQDIIVKRQTDKRYSISGITARDDGEIYNWSSIYKKRLPIHSFQWDHKTKCDFIAGLFDADGTALDNKNEYAYQITSIHEDFLKDFLCLLKSIGVYGNITLSHKGGYRDMPGGNYYCKPCWRLTIPQRYSIKLSKQVKFERLKDFSERYCSYRISHKYNKIVDIRTLDGRHNVYCCTLSSTNRILTATGIITGQCGEQMLSYWNNCLLGSFALPKYFKHDDFMWDEFRYDVKTATRLMNLFSNINEDKHPLEKQREADKFGKRIGIEFTGLGDVLAQQDYEYGDQKSMDFCNFLTSNLLESSVEESINIAKEQGCCSALDLKESRKNLLENDFSGVLINFEEEILNYGMANCALLTVGPTGTLSIVSGNVTSGIEPLFKFSYKRKNRIDGKEYSFIHLPAAKYMLENLDQFEGLTLKEAKEELNYLEADEIPWKKRINVQASLQKNIDASISSTINLPNNSTKEDIQEIYKYAWEKELKGVTVFREGCKEGVLSGITEEPEEVECIIPEIFEKELLDQEEAVRHRVSWKKSKLYVNVSIDDDNLPIEIFTKLPKEAGKGENGQFSLPLFNERSSNWDLISRLISLCLRYGISLEHIIEQLDKSSYSMVDAASILKRILSKYVVINKGDIQYGMECPECKELSYFKEGGCGKCLECGFSECG